MIKQKDYFVKLRKIPREELQRIAARVEALGIPCPVA